MSEQDQINEFKSLVFDERIELLFAIHAKKQAIAKYQKFIEKWIPKLRELEFQNDIVVDRKFKQDFMAVELKPLVIDATEDDLEASPWITEQEKRDLSRDESIFMDESSESSESENEQNASESNSKSGASRKSGSDTQYQNIENLEKVLTGSVKESPKLQSKPDEEMIDSFGIGDNITFGDW